MNGHIFRPKDSILKNQILSIFKLVHHTTENHEEESVSVLSH